MVLVGYIIALLIAFYLIAEISDRYFVVSLDHIANKLSMSHEMAGATLMAIGSSAPELFVAIIALVKPGNHGAIGVGTIVGSALFNILVIVGAAAIVKKAVLVWQPVFRDLLFYLLSVVALYLVLRDGQITLMESSILVGLYGAYLIAVMKWQKWFKYTELDQIEEVEEDGDEKKGWKVIFIPLDFLLQKLFPAPKYYVTTFVVSIVAIAFLCWVLVESAIGVSEILHVPEVIIALTVVAVGTSIPDMISSIIVAKQGRGGMAVSNAVGSNIFDILIGLGLPWLLVIGYKSEVVAPDTANLFESIGLLLASVVFIFFTFVLRKWQLGRSVGYILIFAYASYVCFEIVRFLYA